MHAGVSDECLHGGEKCAAVDLQAGRDCQTCFMCELYCPVDAFYVAPEVEHVTRVSEHGIAATGLLGSYRQNGWAVALGAERPMDQSFKLTDRG